MFVMISKRVREQYECLESKGVGEMEIYGSK